MKERPIFISYSSKDYKRATETCEYLEKNGLDCWIAPRNIAPGSDYAEGIMDGLKNCRILVLLASENINDSRHILSEVRTAFDENKQIFPFRIQNFQYADNYIYFLGGAQWVDAFDDFYGSLSVLLDNLKKHLAENATPATYYAPKKEKPSAATAKDDKNADPFQDAIRSYKQKFEIRDGVLLKYNGSDETVKVPDIVKVIGRKAFRDYVRLLKVVIPEGVQKIEDEAFYGCIKLTEINIPASVKVIEDEVFAQCGRLERVNLSVGVEELGDGIFDRCLSLKKITIPNTVKKIRYGAFDGCINLSEIDLPEGLIAIDGKAFNGCASLKSVILPNTIADVGENAFDGCENLRFNEFDNGYYIGTAKNPNAVFIKARSTDIAACTIHENTRVIAKNAFKDCGALKSIYVPEGVIRIGDHAFENCVLLKDLSLPASLASVGDWAFENCRRLKVNKFGKGNYLGNNDLPYLLLFKAASADTANCVINPKTKIIYDYAFAGCDKLVKAVVPDKVKTVGSGAFCGCKSLTSVTIGKGVKTIGYECFCGCESLAEITISDGVETIGDHAFDGCAKLARVTLGKKLSSIGKNAFENCESLTVIDLPDSVTDIGYETFLNCTALKKVNIGKGLCRIGNSAFCGCENLKEFNANEENAAFSVYDHDLYDVSGERLVRYAVGKTTVEFDLPEKVRSIDDGAFDGGKNLKVVSVAKNVENIGRNAFADCGDLEIATVGDSVKYLGEGAFEGCSKLTSITLGANLLSIGKNAFDGCTSLTGIDVDNKNKVFRSIDGNLYDGEETTFVQYAVGKRSTALTLPKTVTEIAPYAFGGAHHLAELYIPSDISRVGECAFEYCKNLKFFEWESGLYLGNKLSPYLVFVRPKTDNVVSCTIHKTTKVIYGRAFENCALLQNLIISGNVLSIGTYPGTINSYGNMLSIVQSG